jgi:hypothetical protein
LLLREKLLDLPMRLACASEGASMAAETTAATAAAVRRETFTE